MGTKLRGITWDHPRGYQGLFKATEFYLHSNPEVEIIWEKHSLRHFEAFPVGQLADKYDLIVLDHPFMGDVFQSQCLLGLTPYSESLELGHLAADSVGQSFDSYVYGGELWALPIDAACQTAVYRRDLLAGQRTPETWEEVRNLAQKYRLALALHGVHGFLVFAAICANLGKPLRTDTGDFEAFIDNAAGMEALEILQELYGFCPAEALDWNAIDCLDAMSMRDDLAYSPYVFNYCSYSHESKGHSRLTFTRIPGVRDNRPGGAVLGGTGLAISRQCQSAEEALKFAKYAVSEQAQLLMGLNGGQSARRSVWLNDELNQAYDNFYQNTLSTIDQAYLRPRHAGYMGVQNQSGKFVEDFLRKSIDAETALNEMNESYRNYMDRRQYDGEFMY